MVVSHISKPLLFPASVPTPNLPFCSRPRKVSQLTNSALAACSPVPLCCPAPLFKRPFLLYNWSMKKGALQTVQPESFHPSLLGETPSIAHATVPGYDNRTGLGFKHFHQSSFSSIHCIMNISIKVGLLKSCLQNLCVKKICNFSSFPTPCCISGTFQICFLLRSLLCRPVVTGREGSLRGFLGNHSFDNTLCNQILSWRRE